MILILSSESDIHAQEVMHELANLGTRPTLLDLSLYPQYIYQSWHYDKSTHSYLLFNTSLGKTIDLDSYRVIWWRRPQPYDLHPQISNYEYRQFAYTETHEAFTGMWQTLDAFWINHPMKDERAHRKVYQLMVAKNVGLPIPETLITSDPERARRFIEAQGVDRTVYKAFSATQQVWRESRLIKHNEMALIDNVRYAPVIFQEYIPAQYDLRVTVVGERIFPAAIYSQETSYKVDVRMDIANARLTPTTLPDFVEDHIYELMNALGLVYGAIDMRLTPQGDYVFLEINPAGQWLFIEEKTQQPISAAMAQLMLEKDSA